MSEGLIYRREDKHAQAYELLIAPDGLGQRMARALNIADLSQARQCLSCHSGWLSTRGIEKPPTFESGVTCESCHGPSRLWDEPHSEPAWRKVTIDEKKKLGMTDVRDPVVRAKLCYSCHIGNSDEGKVVTHDMYAAGHPPLPGVEIETFVAAMPAHSRKLEEKGDFEFRKEFIRASRSGSMAQAPDGLPRTKGVLVGGIIALRESLQLFAQQSGPDKGPEFAMFDCQACHHELRLPAWRQARAGLGRPGRPRLPEWPAVLATIGIAQGERDPAAAQRDLKLLQEQLQQLARALDERPFGGSSNVQDVINGRDTRDDGLLGWLDKKAQALAARSFDHADAERALVALYRMGSTGVHDFHSARQIAWAIRVIETESRLNYPSFPQRVATLPLKERRSLEESDIRLWRDWRQSDWKSADAQAAAIMAALNNPLHLTLPARQTGSIGDNLKALLETTAGYDPESFRMLLQEAADKSQPRSR
jgi:hypothetical protein